jgi:hypothetical protein
MSPTEESVAMTSLKYPHDRFNGFVQLTDGNGAPYVFDCPYPDYGSKEGHAMKFSGAFLALANRMDKLRSTNKSEDEK